MKPVGQSSHRGLSEHALGARIPIRDESVQRDRNNGVIRRLNDCRQPPKVHFLRPAHADFFPQRFHRASQFLGPQGNFSSSSSLRFRMAD